MALAPVAARGFGLVLLVYSCYQALNNRESEYNKVPRLETNPSDTAAILPSTDQIDVLTSQSPITRPLHPPPFLPGSAEHGANHTYEVKYKYDIGDTDEIDYVRNIMKKAEEVSSLYERNDSRHSLRRLHPEPEPLLHDISPETDSLNSFVKPSDYVVRYLILSLPSVLIFSVFACAQHG